MHYVSSNLLCDCRGQCYFQIFNFFIILVVRLCQISIPYLCFFLFQKRYACEICFVSYTNKQNLAGHQFKHHGIGEPLICECGAQFVWAFKLSRHKKTCQVVQKKQNSTAVVTDLGNKE